MQSPSDYILNLTDSKETVTVALAEDPSLPVDKIVEALEKSWKSLKSNSQTESKKVDEREALDRAARCGKFPERPSDLFLKIYRDVLGTLENDPLAGVVSPSLLGSSGVIPLSIVSVIPDIMRHYAELIVAARSEVFIATNYWENSHSARIVSDSLRELSKRTPEGKKVIVKLMYDRGTPKQVIKNHAEVMPEEWEKVGLPNRDEITNLSLQVVNYHRPVLGTFHAKYLVVDRQVACLNSNNIQDRPNVEMCIHLEGPIVESFYDMALISWANALEPQLPLLSQPQDYTDRTYKFEQENPHLKYIDTDYMAAASRSLLKKQMESQKKDQDEQVKEPKHKSIARHVKNVGRMAANIHTGGGRELGKDEHIGAHPHMKVPIGRTGGNTSEEHHGQSDEQSEQGQAGEADQDQGDPQLVAAEESQDSLASTQGEIPGEDDNKDSRVEEVSASNNPTETSVQGQQGDEEKNLSRVELLAAYLNSETLNAEGTAKDDNSLDDFRPHILHKEHKPVPIAMVNRHPRGTPGHDGVHTVPQDVAWLSAINNAERNIFIQSPTFNASPVIPATLDACRRGVQVTLYLDLGFNDLGEMIPFQGGTNEQVIAGMYAALNAEGKGLENNLHVFWYTAKDQSEPMSATAKKRNCHVKYMSVDDQIAIVGNGNQDTQSWFHSQEINVLVDSPQLVEEWWKGINANQNTAQHGRVDVKDGVWRDETGRIVQSSGTKKAGLFGGLKGISGAINRVRGTGGF